MEDEFENKYLEKQLIIPPDWQQARLYGQQSHIGRIVAPVGSASNDIESTVLGIRPVRHHSYSLEKGEIPSVRELQKYTRSRIRSADDVSI